MGHFHQNLSAAPVGRIEPARGSCSATEAPSLVVHPGRSCPRGRAATIQSFLQGPNWTLL
jgi:hypothetical protein